MFARFRDDNDFLADPVSHSGRGSWVGHTRLPDVIGNSCIGGRCAAKPFANVGDSECSTDTLRLPDGRTLAWAEYGHRHGYPLIYFHSQAGSRLEAGLLHDTALAAGFRLIAIDRPGIGKSDFRTLKRHWEFGADVQALISHLTLLNPGLISWAGGAPFALALAASPGVSVSFVTLLAPTPAPAFGRSGGVRAGPGRTGFSYVSMFISRIMTGVMQCAIGLRQPLAGKKVSVKIINRHLFRLREQVSHADRRVLDKPWVRDLLLRDAQQATLKGTRGAAQDSVMALRGWDFNLADIKVPVHIWHGCADTVTPLRCSNNLARSLPTGMLHAIRCQGHFFHGESMLDIFRRVRQELQSVRRSALSRQASALPRPFWSEQTVRNEQTLRNDQISSDQINKKSA